MKVVAILDTHLSSGGGFNQALNAILQMQRLSNGLFEFHAVTLSRDNIAFLSQLGVTASLYKKNWRDKWFASIAKRPSGLAFLCRHKILSGIEAHMLGMGADLAYFVTPESSFSRLQRLNYITTLWDLCHRDFPEFPEVREFGAYHRREEHYRQHLGAAVCILTDSEKLSKAASFRYGIDPERLLSMPFAPSPFLENPSANSTADVLTKHGLSEGYFFYPAQFWPHKNHVRILEALILLRDSGKRPSVVFCGRDYGSEPNVRAFAQARALDAQVKFLGFVDPEDIQGLYRGCKALIMPTYFGPTNIPPLEAWSLKKPVIYSALHSEQAGDAALLVDPDDAAELANAMEAIGNVDVQEGLLEAGRRRLDQIALERTVGEGALIQKLKRFAARRECWA